MFIMEQPAKRSKLHVDEISALSDELLSHIFSYFTRTQLGSTLSLVSKKWHSIVQSCQLILAFNLKSFSNTMNDEVEKRFFDSIHHSLDKIAVGHVPVRVMKIQLVEKSSNEKIFFQLKSVMNCLAKLNFKELYLKDVGEYNLPIVLENSNFLNVLHVTSSCSFYGLDFNDIPILDSLRELVLENAAFYGAGDKLFFEYLNIKFPSLVELTLTNCRYLANIDMPDHKTLKKLCVIQYGYSVGEMKRVKIGVKGLQAFQFCYHRSNTIEIDINECQMLQYLHLHCQSFPIGFDTTNICSTFPHIRNLFLYLKKPLSNTLGIVSDKVEELTIWNNDDLCIPVDIVTPNLRSFKYVGGTTLNYENFAPKDATKIVKTQITLYSL